MSPTPDEEYYWRWPEYKFDIPLEELGPTEAIRRRGIELIKYLNVGRTFTTARELYIPPGKIRTTVHYFAASQSKKIKKESWNDYCCKPINSYEITGDHYSILKKPSVIDFSRLFGIIIAATMKKSVIIGNRKTGTRRSKSKNSKNK